MRPPAGVTASRHSTTNGWRRRWAPKGGPFAEDPLASLVLHVSRETMHHGGEIGLLRDLYRDGFAAGALKPS